MRFPARRHERVLRVWRLSKDKGSIGNDNHLLQIISGAIDRLAGAILDRQTESTGIASHLEW